MALSYAIELWQLAVSCPTVLMTMSCAIKPLHRAVSQWSDVELFSGYTAAPLQHSIVMLCHSHTVLQLYPCQRHLSLCFCRAHGRSSCFSHPICSSALKSVYHSIDRQTHTHTHTHCHADTCSTYTHMVSSAKAILLTHPKYAQSHTVPSESIHTP